MNWTENPEGGEMAEYQGCYLVAKKLDRRVDPYWGSVIDTAGLLHTGLFSSMAKAKSWCRGKALEFTRTKTHAEA